MDEQDEFVKYVAGGIFRYGHAQRSSDVILWFAASGAFCIGSNIMKWLSARLGTFCNISRQANVFSLVPVFLHRVEVRRTLWQIDHLDVLCCNSNGVILQLDTFAIIPSMTSSGILLGQQHLERSRRPSRPPSS